MSLTKENAKMKFTYLNETERQTDMLEPFKIQIKYDYLTSL